MLAGIETTTLAYIENDAAKDVTDLITITDVDDVNIESAIVAIVANYQSGQDVLAFTGTAFITGSWDAGTGVLSLSGSTTVANYRAALRNVTYQNTSENPSALTRTVSFTVNDGDLSSNIATRNISVSAVNDAPVLSSIELTALPYTENQIPANITATLNINDGDDTNMESATVRLLQIINPVRICLPLRIPPL